MAAHVPLQLPGPFNFFTSQLSHEHWCDQRLAPLHISWFLGKELHVHIG